MFVGLTSYYRRFIPHFASLASPLTDLTWDRLPAQVTWTEETEKAFQDIKGALCSGPVLVTPDFGGADGCVGNEWGQFCHNYKGVRNTRSYILAGSCCHRNKNIPR